MIKNKLENKIGEKFNELSDIFPESINSSDFRVNAILNFFGDINSKTVLDVGCGKGRFSRITAEKGAIVTGVDISKKLLGTARRKIKNVNFVRDSATNLSFSNESFDYVFSVEVLEHVPHTQTTIKEMVRVLKKNGKIIIIDKNKLSIHDKFFLPNVLIKKYMEMRDKWMYPHNFPFTEKWFFPWEIDKIMRKYCRKTWVGYIQENWEKKLFKHFPFLNLFVAWKGVK